MKQVQFETFKKIKDFSDNQKYDLVYKFNGLTAHSFPT